VDALEQVTVGDTGGREEAVVAPDQVFEGQDRFEVVPGVEGGRRSSSLRGHSLP
jgi:hypothetical protein